MLPSRLIRLRAGKCYYRYADRDFTIYNNELSTEEVKSLSQTANILRRFRGMPSFNWIEEVVSNLEYRFGGKTVQENVISFDQNERQRGLEHLPARIEITFKIEIPSTQCFQRLPSPAKRRNTI